MALGSRCATRLPAARATNTFILHRFVSGFLVAAASRFHLTARRARGGRANWFRVDDDTRLGAQREAPLAARVNADDGVLKSATNSLPRRRRGCTRRDLPAAVTDRSRSQLHDVAVRRSQGVEIVGPSLHHLASLAHVAGPVVRGANLVSLGVCELPFDHVRRPSHFIESRARERSESMPGHRLFVVTGARRSDALIGAVAYRTIGHVRKVTRTTYGP